MQGIRDKGLAIWWLRCQLLDLGDPNPNAMFSNKDHSVSLGNPLQLNWIILHGCHEDNMRSPPFHPGVTLSSLKEKQDQESRARQTLVSTWFTQTHTTSVGSPFPSAYLFFTLRKEILLCFFQEILDGPQVSHVLNKLFPPFLKQSSCNLLS